MPDMHKSAWLTIAAALLMPLVSMAIVPFYDTSEPRYAEIARIMAQSGDWITPWFRPDLPFWGKPPLSFWAQGLSMKAFGTSEFAARLPSWLCLLASCGILLTGLRSLYGLRIALSSAIIYSTCALVYIAAGAVLTDPFLALGTTLCLVSFAVSVQEPGDALRDAPPQRDARRRKGRASWWSYGFFAGLSIGLLAKGPLAAVLSFTPVLTWYARNRKTASLAAALPWRTGLALVAVACLPWYLLAEARTPGFLDYFIVGEHFRRFLDPGWTGDLYGSAHKRAYGTIWLYWLQASFPWGIIVLAALLGTLRSMRLRSAARAVGNDPLFSYWLAGALFAPCFFTASANILWTYILPSLAGFSILAALFMHAIPIRQSVSRRALASAATLVPGTALALSLALWLMPDLGNTERGFVRYVQQQDTPMPPLLYFAPPPFSARFYSAGLVAEASPAQLQGRVACGPPFYLAIPKNKQAIVDELLGAPPPRLQANRRHVLVRISPPRPCNP